MLAAIAMAANACDTGAYNDLECDSDYVSECLTADAYMFCNNNTLQVAYCSTGQICVQGETGHSCVSAIEGGCTTSSCNGNILNKCNNGTSSTEDCSLKGMICDPTTLSCVTPTETCTTPVCDTDGVTLKDCVSGLVSIKSCAATNQICGTNESGIAACIDAPAETCTETVCDADTNVLKVCNIPDGETEGTVEEKDCTEDGMICGVDDDGNPACISGEPEVCTEDACSEDGNILKHCKIEDGEDHREQPEQDIDLRQAD